MFRDTGYILTEQIMLISQEFERVTGQRCNFLSKGDSDYFNCELSEANCPDFCFEIAKSPIGHYHCQRKRHTMIASAISRREPIFSSCHAGLYEIIVPVFSGTSVIGVLNAFFKPDALPDIIMEQQDIYEQKYRCDVKILLNKICHIAPIHKNLLQTAALLLNSLVLMYIPLESPPRIEHMKPEVSEEENIDLYKLYKFATCPLFKQARSKLIDENKDDPQTYQILDEIIERAVNLLFINIRNGDMVKAKEFFKSIFNIIYLEKDFSSQKRSAQFLIYKCDDIFQQKISFLKEVYSRSNSIGNKLLLTQNTPELRKVVGDYFNSTVQIYQIADKDKNPLVNRIIKYIDEHYDRPFTVKDMEQSLNISSSHSNRIFTEQMGVGIKWYINEIRMYYAQHYLRNTNWPINTVALKVGYTDVRSFYKIFDKYYSIPCAKFKRFDSK